MTALLSPSMLAERLNTLLDGLIAAYERLAVAGMGHREAIRTADTHGMDRAVRAQTAMFRELAKLDQQRRELVAHAHASFPALSRTATDRTTLSQLATLASDSKRADLARKAEALRAVVRGVQEQNTGIKTATLSLVAHVEGIMRQVARQLSHTGTYSRRGVVEAVPGVLSAVDLST